MKAYKPSTQSIDAAIRIQEIARSMNMTVLEASKLLGFDCPYSWMKSIME